MKGKSSPIWNFFHQVRGSDSRAKCSVCGAVLSYKATTNNLRKHFQKQHPLVHVDGRETQPAIPVAVPTEDENIKFLYSEAMEVELPAEPVPEASSSSADQKADTKSFFKRKSSLLWNFFSVVPGSDSKVSCGICTSEMNYKGATSNMRKHMRKKHPHVNIDSVRGQVVPTENANENDKLMYESFEKELEVAAAQTQEAPSTSKKSKKSAEITDALLRLFTVDLQPFSVVADSGFKSFVKALNPTYQLPSPETIADSLPPTYEEAYKASRNALDAIPSVTLTIDYWNSSNSTESFVAVTAHFLNNNFDKKSVLLECSSFEKPPTDLDLSAELARVVNEWGLDGKVLVVISDNSDHIASAVNDLNLQHFGCFAQRLNLVAEGALELVSCNVDTVRTIVRHFKLNRTSSSNLVRQQGLSPKELIQSEPTRWNSTFYMLERFVDLEEHLRIALGLSNENLPEISPEEWSLLGEIVKILKPLESISKMMSVEKYITTSSILILTDGLIDVYSNLAKQAFTDSAKKVVDRILAGLNGRLGDLEKNESLVLTTFLDPRFKNFGISNEITAHVARKQIETLLTDMIDHKFEDSTQPVNETVDLEDSIWSKFDKKIANSQPTGNAHSKAVLEIEHYLEEPLISRNKDPLSWWKDNSFNLPNLSELVRLKFIPVATSVPCERLFTTAGLVLSDRRSRLSSSDVKSVLFFNTMSETVVR